MRDQPPEGNQTLEQVQATVQANPGVQIWFYTMHVQTVLGPGSVRHRSVHGLVVWTSQETRSQMYDKIRDMWECTPDDLTLNWTLDPEDRP